MAPVEDGELDGIQVEPVELVCPDAEFAVVLELDDTIGSDVDSAGSVVSGVNSEVVGGKTVVDRPLDVVPSSGGGGGVVELEVTGGGGAVVGLAEVVGRVVGSASGWIAK